MKGPAAVARLRELVDGYRNTALIFAAAKLEVADRLALGPMDVRSLASELGVEPGPLGRLLRGLETLEVVRVAPDGRYALDSLGESLRSGASGSVADWAILAGEEYLAAWGALPRAMRSGPTPFEHVFGESPWEHRRRNPRLGVAFQRCLAEETASAAGPIVQALGLAGVAEVADVAGGRGVLLAAALRAHPDLHGVLIDLPEVTAQAAAILDGDATSGRWRVEPADILEAVPPLPDVSFLKSVLHDWDDGRCLTILRNCRDSMPPAGRLVVVERVTPERATDDPATVLLDLHMFAVLGGRERSLEDFRRLAASAELHMRSVNDSGVGFQLMELVRDD